MIPQTFLSHNQADSAWVEQFHASLCRRLRISRASELIYLDRHMAPGVVWTPFLWGTFMKSAIFIFAVSQHSAQSDWVRDECQRAMALQHDDPSRIIIPLVLDYAGYIDQISPDLRRFQYADFTGVAHDHKRSEYQEMVRRLAYVMEHPKALRSGSGGVPIPLEPLWSRSVKVVRRLYLGE